MFLHSHPYEPFLFEEARKLIVGTLPPPRFTTGQLREGDVDFCYGSRDGQLWRILDRIFNLDLKYETTWVAIEQRMAFLRERRIGICDMVDSAKREKVDASDLGMSDIQLRDLVGILKHYRNVEYLLFTGGNSKNGPEYLFRRHLRQYRLSLNEVDINVPRIHSLELPSELSGTGEPRLIRTVSLTAPSGSANRAVGSLRAYKEMKKMDPEFTTLDFRVQQYRPFF